MISPPLEPARCMARRIWPSSERKTPGYAVKSLNEVTPAETSPSISLSEDSFTSDMIMWKA